MNTNETIQTATVRLVAAHIAQGHTLAESVDLVMDKMSTERPDLAARVLAAAGVTS